MHSESENKLLIEVGQRIRRARTGQGLSLHQIARLTGISASALSMIETAKRDARLTTLDRISKALRVPLPVLLGEQVEDKVAKRTELSSGYDLGEFM